MKTSSVKVGCWAALVSCCAACATDPSATSDAGGLSDSAVADGSNPTDAASVDGSDGSIEGGSDAACTVPDAGAPPSCAGSGPGLSDCPGGDCCASIAIPGGTFARNNDSKTSATLSGFRLDRYEITVGRFRKFVAAVAGGWTPTAGTGKHSHLDCGQGLRQSGGSLHETGWNANWTKNLPASLPAWDTALACDASQTWSAGNDRRPINCITWYEAEAFCIWDGGFLPSEAEWEYAAAGASEQRLYPWGATAPGNDAKLAAYGCFFNGNGNCTGVANIAPVGSIPAGNGKWSHSDLAGNVNEWVIDLYQNPYLGPCTDCAQWTGFSNARVIRGGSYLGVSSDLLAAARVEVPEPTRYNDMGSRCARTP